VTNHVPRSCCALNFNQDRELYWVDPQEIQLKDERKCQEDAEGRILNSANLNRLVRVWSRGVMIIGRRI